MAGALCAYILLLVQHVGRQVRAIVLSHVLWQGEGIEVSLESCLSLLDKVEDALKHEEGAHVDHLPIGSSRR